MKKPLISVIIASYNEEKYIGKLLDSILAQDCKEPFEILIIDGGSQDTTKDIVKKYTKKHKNVRLFNNPKRKPAHAFNKGIKNSKGKYIALIGAHSQAQQNWLSKSLQTLIEAPTEVMVVGGKLLSGRTTSRFAKAVDYTTSTFWGGGVSTHRFSKKKQYADTVVFGLYKKEVFEKVGLMDTKLVVGQDGELNYRIRKKGYKLLFNPQIQTIYHSKTSPKKFSKQMYNYGVGRVKIMQKHGLHKIGNLMPLLFGFYIYLLPIFIVIGILGRHPINLIGSILTMPFVFWLIITLIMSLRKIRLFKESFTSYWITFFAFSKGMVKELLFSKKNNYR